MSEPVSSMLTKLTYGGLGLLLLVTIGPTFIGSFGLVDGAGMEPITYILVFGVLPIAAVFILLYIIWNGFAKRD